MVCLIIADSRSWEKVVHQKWQVRGVEAGKGS